MEMWRREKVMAVLGIHCEEDVGNEFVRACVNGRRKLEKAQLARECHGSRDE